MHRTCFGNVALSNSLLLTVHTYQFYCYAFYQCSKGAHKIPKLYKNEVKGHLNAKFDIL